MLARVRPEYWATQRRLTMPSVSAHLLTLRHGLRDVDRDNLATPDSLNIAHGRLAKEPAVLAVELVCTAA
jgi:hypothetical protein